MCPGHAVHRAVQNVVGVRGGVVREAAIDVAGAQHVIDRVLNDQRSLIPFGAAAHRSCLRIRTRSAFLAAQRTKAFSEENVFSRTSSRPWRPWISYWMVIMVCMMAQFKTGCQVVGMGGVTGAYGWGRTVCQCGDLQRGQMVITSLRGRQAWSHLMQRRGRGRRIFFI